jgi:hypothetical protein
MLLKERQTTRESSTQLSAHIHDLIGRVSHSYRKLVSSFQSFVSEKGTI